MPDFGYLAVDPRGKERRGTVKANSDSEARSRLQSQRLYVVKVQPQPVAERAATRRWGARKLSSKQLTLFTRQLATISRVSPLEEALRTIARQSEQQHVRDIVARVADAVVEGRRFADALAREPKSFPALYRAMVSAGETSGTLPEILERLAALLERQAEMRGKLITALAYPAVLTLVAVGVVAALMIAVVPRVVEQFDDAGQQLPLLTRIVIAISDVMAGYWWAMLLGLVGLALVSARLLREEAVRLPVDRWLLRLPLIGRLIRDLHAARLARTLATMIESRLPVIEGLKLTRGTVHNHALRNATDGIIEAIRGGGSLSTAIGRAGVFPPLLVYFAASGETAGQLDTMLARAADYLEREFDNFTATALSMLEPGIIVVMGGVVATIVLAILLPILQLQSLIGG
jgi:general secretion pathway protein F